MRAERIIFPARGEVALEAHELPEPGPADVRVRTLYSLMSIGTETIILHQRYDPGTHFDEMFSFPQLQTGVQATGVVDACGKDVKEFAVGDRVFIRRAHGSHQVLPAAHCSPVPVGVDLRSACWCGLAKTAFRAAHAGRFELGAPLLIVGAGPVGQMALRWARASGNTPIAIVDLSTERLEHARRGGADLVFERDIADCVADTATLGGGAGPSVVVDTTGNPRVFQCALAAAARFGKVILLGDTGYPSRQCLSSDMMRKGLTVQAVHDSHDLGGWTQRRIDRLFFELLQTGRFDVSGLITHEFLPKDCADAYLLADRQRNHAMGILYRWSPPEE